MSANIEIKILEEGEKIKRMIELARERNINYEPSAEAMDNLMCYIDRKGLPNPLGDGKRHQPVAPVYNPLPGPGVPPLDFNYQPPPGMPPAGMPPGGGFQPGPIFLQGVPAYTPSFQPGIHPGFQSAMNNTGYNYAAYDP